MATAIFLLAHGLPGPFRASKVTWFMTFLLSSSICGKQSLIKNAHWSIPFKYANPALYRVPSWRALKCFLCQSLGADVWLHFARIMLICFDASVQGCVLAWILRRLGVSVNIRIPLMAHWSWMGSSIWSACFMEPIECVTFSIYVFR